ncbi:MAG TPA: M56 family metallopeptidase [Bryobacteraceae bacterium]|nr:M56 family metallopeptidase [Bryobacteraceae bacterium]
MTPFFRVLMDASIRISLVALAVAIVLLLARVRSSSVRHRAWLAVLCAMLSMPVLPHLAPRVNIPVPAGAGPVGSPIVSEVPADLSSLPVAATAASPGHAAAPIAPWPAIFLALYAAGVAAFLYRLLAGWLLARRVLAASRRISIPNLPVYESPQVSTPLTIGLAAQKILLPMDWREWPEDKLRAVLAHELAHVQRRDTISSFGAHLNRCFFWFHPLAWWLEGQLALTAEQACDDAAVRAIGERRRYAEVLLDMAETVRRRGNRLACPGVGVEGTGLLGRRIDRILRGASVPAASRAQKALVALTCAAAIFGAAACRQQSVYSVQLKPDPQYTATLAKQKADADLNRAAREMDARQVADLEALVRQNPEDLEARRKLMIFYQTSGRRVLGDQKTATAFWSHKLWCIQHHPGDQCASMTEPLSDPAAYQKAKQLWLAAIQPKEADPRALIPAAMFFKATDPQLAERIALRLPTTDGRRTGLLARIYASALADSASRGPYAQEVSQKLEGSQDATLLADAGFDLSIRRGINGKNPGASALGLRYLQRALALDPNSAEAHDGLARIRQQDFYTQFYQRMYQTVGQKPSETQYQKVSALPANQRFEFLPYLAENAYTRGDMLDYYNHDRAGARQAWELARRYAQEALRLAPRFSSAANYGNCFYKANMTLGMLAMRVDGNRKAAREYLLAASTAHTTDNSVAPFTFKLPVLLLKYGGPGERKAVIEFLETYGKTLHRKDLDLLLAAKQLRQGTMPLWYQYQSAQLR